MLKPVVLGLSVLVGLGAWYFAVTDSMDPKLSLSTRLLLRFGAGTVSALRKLDATFGLVDYLGLLQSKTREKHSDYLNETVGLQITEISLANVDVVHFRPKKFSPDSYNRAVIYVHGGGWVLCSPKAKEHYLNSIEVADRLQAHVFSVDYRKAPEFPFPAAFDDVFAVTKHILAEGHHFGVDTARVAIWGDSAGGNLAATVAVQISKAINEGKLDSPPLKLQVPIYPVIQCDNFATKSYVKSANDPLLPREFMIHFFLAYAYGEKWREYRNEAIRTNKMSTEHLKNEKFSPIYATELSSLNKVIPPAILITCERDVLRDDGLLYQRLLETIDVECHHRNYDLHHGAFTMASSGSYEAAKQILMDIIDMIEKNKML